MCLNQKFIKRRSPTVDIAAIKSTSIGKDMETSSTTVVANLFKKPARKKGAATDADEKFVQRLVRDINTCDEGSRIAVGEPSNPTPRSLESRILTTPRLDRLL